MTEREQFEAALAEKPEVRFWNTTDAMFWAWQAARAQPAQAGQVLDVVELMRAVLDADQRTTHTRGTTNWAAAIGRSVERALLAKRVPMTDEQADDILLACMPLTNPHRLMRAVERHHGIGGEKGGA